MALRSVQFSFAGTLSDRSQTELSDLIQKQGGKFSEEITNKTTFVISSEEMVFVLNDAYKLQFLPELKQQIDLANMYQIPIIQANFVDQCILAKRIVDHHPYLIKGFEVDVESKFKVNQTQPSNLDPRVQSLVKMLFDEKEMSRSLVDLGLDVRKMSLITQHKIKEAYKVLKKVESKLQPSSMQTASEHESELRRISEEFYRLIPTREHSVIKTIDAIKEKSNLLATLTDIEIAQRLMKSGRGDSDLNMNPVDINYRKLRAKITPVEEYRAEFSLIKSMVENTQSKEFPYQLELVEVFEIDREGETDRFADYKRLPHHRLLYHGSRLTNYIGILSQGLRIAPPEAPVTGYFLGKGIYLADMVSVSAQYLHASKEQPYGLMLLVDAALGRAFQLAHGKYISKEDLDGAGFHSVKCWGTKGPDPGYDKIVNDGLIASLGSEGKTGVPVSELVHSEIVVYDEKQVNMKYLMKVKFNFVEKEYEI